MGLVLAGGGGSTRAAQNKKIRQEALREQLSNKGLLQHVLEIEKQFRESGGNMQPNEIQAKKAAADINLKLINKYLPDLKATEITGADGESVKIDNTWIIKFEE